MRTQKGSKLYAPTAGQTGKAHTINLYRNLFCRIRIYLYLRHEQHTPNILFKMSNQKIINSRMVYNTKTKTNFYTNTQKSKKYTEKTGTHTATQTNWNTEEKKSTARWMFIVEMKSDYNLFMAQYLSSYRTNIRGKGIVQRCLMFLCAHGHHQTKQNLL